MATDEARALLDSLMGGDRNAPLPPGAAVPLSKKQKMRLEQNGSGDSGGGLWLPGRRSKSCYDKDIDPLYTAWGVDVYELFVNTKSDIGTNPYIVDRGAHEEFVKLPPPEQEALGYHYQLFQKLQELVRQCDRIVTRNKDKLAQEVNRKLSQRGGQDFVETVDEQAVDRLATDLLHFEHLQISLQQQSQALLAVVAEEEEKRKALDLIFEKQQQEAKEKERQEQADARVQEEQQEDGQVKQETEESVNLKKEPIEDEDDPAADADADSAKKRNRDDPTHDDNGGSGSGGKNHPQEEELMTLQVDLGRITMQKQQILFDMANTITRLTPLQDNIEQQHRNLNYVKSDISTDKTVCDVSGNFMSSRDADERIAAHYAGKQYVGWKLVREKHLEMIRKWGRYGPPPPSSSSSSRGRGAAAAGPPPHMMMDRGGGEGGGRFNAGGPPLPPPGRYDDRGHDHRRGGGTGGYSDRRDSSGGPRGGGYGGGGDFRRGGGPPARGHWRR